MTIQLAEQHSSRSGSGNGDFSSRQVRVWHSSGSDDLAAIVTALKAAAPVSITCPVNAITLYRTQINYEPRGFEKYKLEIEYVDAEVVLQIQRLAETHLDAGESRVTFSTTGGTARITTSLETVSSYKQAGDANPIPDFGQSIGVTREGDVQGVDIVVPALKLQISYRQPYATITDAYVRTLELMTGTVNNASWKGRAAGEVLFMGADGVQGTAVDPELTYQFLRLPNISGQTIGDIVNVAKKGHEYLWVIFEDRIPGGGAAPFIPKKPKYVKVERVYPTTDFSALGIGT
jgi:hypothetical protein